jgi:Chaperone of endosialidase
VVSSTGQLGVATSSARYKRDIRDMGGASAGLMRLRPVSFRYKDDPSRTLQYGLVAEEVARVYPELVTRDTDGKLQSVRYLEFTALLLNELQKQARENKELRHENRELRSERAQNRAEVAKVRAEQARERAGFDERLSALEQSLQAGKSEARLSAIARQTRDLKIAEMK